MNEDLVYNPRTRKWYKSGTEIPLGTIYNTNRYEYTQYNSDGTKTRMNPLEYAKIKQQRNFDKHSRIDNQYSFDNKGLVTILDKNLGKIKVSQQMIDAFLKYGKMAGVSKVVALGLPFQESSFGQAKNRGIDYTYDYNQDTEYHGWSQKGNNHKYSPVVMFSNWHYFEGDPYKVYVNETNKVTNQQLESEKKARKRNNVQKYEIGYNHFNKQAKSYVDNYNPIYDAYSFFKTGKYNLLDNNHTHDVLEKGRLLLQNPEIQKMIRQSKYYY